MSETRAHFWLSGAPLPPPPPPGAYANRSPRRYRIESGGSSLRLQVRLRRVLRPQFREFSFSISTSPESTLYSIAHWFEVWLPPLPDRCGGNWIGAWVSWTWSSSLHTVQDVRTGAHEERHAEAPGHHAVFEQMQLRRVERKCAAHQHIEHDPETLKSTSSTCCFSLLVLF